MFPWGHAAIAYLAYTGVKTRRYGAPPAGYHPVLLGFAALLPDLVDKPLAWSLGVLPSGRAVLHSLVVLLPLCLAVYWLARRSGREAMGVTIVVGLLSHPVGDTLDTLFAGELFASPTFLLWPLLPVADSAGAGYHYLWEITVGPFVVFEAALTLATLGLWYTHGLPGLAWLRRRPVERLRAALR